MDFSPYVCSFIRHFGVSQGSVCPHHKPDSHVVCGVRVPPASPGCNSAVSRLQGGDGQAEVAARVPPVPCWSHWCLVGPTVASQPREQILGCPASSGQPCCWLTVVRGVTFPRAGAAPDAAATALAAPRSSPSHVPKLAESHREEPPVPLPAVGVSCSSCGRWQSIALLFCLSRQPRQPEMVARFARVAQEVRASPQGPW